MFRKETVRRVVLAAALVAMAGGLAEAAPKKRFASLPPSNDLSPSTVSIGSDRGGYVANYGLRMLRWRQNGTKIRFSGRCQSACTIYLGLAPSQVCISPGASFSFHSPFGASARGNRVARMFMKRNYPGWVRSWINSQGGLSGSMKTMSYAHASRFIKPCGSAVAKRSRPRPAEG
jgi:hypothetical protein